MTLQVDIIMIPALQVREQAQRGKESAQNHTVTKGQSQHFKLGLLTLDNMA